MTPPVTFISHNHSNFMMMIKRNVMPGLILHYSTMTQMGILIDENSNRHKFSNDQWQADIEIKRGLKVDFKLDNQGQVIYIRQILMAA